MTCARVLFAMVVLAVLPLASCKKDLTPDVSNLLKPSAITMPVHIAVGDTYYTQFVIRYEKGTHVTTNYRRGASIAVNTPVKLLEITKKTIEVELSGGGKLLVKNLEKHTGDDVFKAFDKLFSKQKINLSKFSKLEREHIENGSVAEGMSKEAVIVAIGYPPITETASLNSDTWVYWSGRFNRFRVHFKNNKVSQIED